MPRLPLLPLLVILLAGRSAQAAPDELSAAIPVTAPWFVPEVLQEAPTEPLAAQAGLLYINFDGADMNGCGWGNNDPKNNCSVIFQGTVLPFSGDAGLRAAVVQYIRKDFEDFNIRVTDIRPGNDVDYDMEMVGDWSPPPQGGFAGVAPSIDCFNQNGGEVSFTLDYTSSAGGIAKAVLQEVAHTWGTEHVDSPADLLFPTTAGLSDPTFQDECFQIVVLNQNNQPVPSEGQCWQQHQQFCDSGDQQNSYRELLGIFGEHVPDLAAPSLSIVSPLQGAEIEGPFDLQINAADEQSPQVLELTIEGQGPSAFKLDAQHYPSPSDLKFPLKGLAAGEYTISVRAVDEEGNQSDAAVDFTILGAPAPTTDGGDSSGEIDSSSGGDETSVPTGAGPPDETGAAPVTTADSSDTGEPGIDDGDDGCGCRHTGPGAPLLLAPLLLGLRRRRP